MLAGWHLHECVLRANPLVRSFETRGTHQDDVTFIVTLHEGASWEEAEANLRRSERSWKPRGMVVKYLLAEA